MKIHTGKNVYQEGIERVKYIFDEFEDVLVGFSGGKDSTVILNLCLNEAIKRNRLPLKVMFLDQEAEWKHTIDYVKSIMYDKRIKPYWLQVPIMLFNATSHESDNWLHCWGEGEKWMREKDPISIKENTYGTNRFKDFFAAFLSKTFDPKKICYVSGVRTEESLARRNGLTNYAFYKHLTWGNIIGEVYTFYPIYDWTLSDVWKAINNNKWKYNKVYDYFYRYGVPPHSMRVSNLNHETALRALRYVQEIEPKTYNALCKRMYGISSSTKMDFNEAFQATRKLPFMFKDWKEYRDHLLNNIVTDEVQRNTFKKKFDGTDALYIGDAKTMEKLYKVEITCILANDYTFTKLSNFMVGVGGGYRNLLKKGIKTDKKGMSKEKIKTLEEMYDAKNSSSYK